MKILKKNLHHLKKNKDLAKEKLCQVRRENEKELLMTSNIKRVLEVKFCNIWDKYQLDSMYMEKEFFQCCKYLVELIVDECNAYDELEEICMPYQDKFQKLSKEYDHLKVESSVKRVKRKRGKRK